MTGDRAFLDVEDDEQRQRRIRGLLEHLDTSSPSNSVPNPLLNVGRERPPGPVEPPTELLERVQAFLPAISASNEALSRQKPGDIDIENVSENEERYIEMNLGLGVFKAKRRHDAELSSDTTSSESDSDSDSSSSDSSDLSDDLDSSSSDDSDSGSQSGSSVNMRPVSSRPIKPLPRRVSEQAKLEV